MVYWIEVVWYKQSLLYYLDKSQCQFLRIFVVGHLRSFGRRKVFLKIFFTIRGKRFTFVLVTINLNLMERQYEFKASGLVVRKDVPNTRQPCQHQKDAQKNLDIVNKNDSFSTLVVLPTGGGKTYTATVWLLRNAIDKNLEHTDTCLCFSVLNVCLSMFTSSVTMVMRSWNGTENSLSWCSRATSRRMI